MKQVKYHCNVYSWNTTSLTSISRHLLLSIKTIHRGGSHVTLLHHLSFHLHQMLYQTKAFTKFWVPVMLTTDMHTKGKAYSFHSLYDIPSLFSCIKWKNSMKDNGIILVPHYSWYTSMQSTTLDIAVPRINYPCIGWPTMNYSSYLVIHDDVP